MIRLSFLEPSLSVPVAMGKWWREPKDRQSQETAECCPEMLSGLLPSIRSVYLSPRNSCCAGKAVYRASPAGRAAGLTEQAARSTGKATED